MLCRKALSPNDGRSGKGSSDDGTERGLWKLSVVLNRERSKVLEREIKDE